MSIKTFYILPLLSGIKSIENICFLTPADKNGSMTRFTPHGVKRVIFLLEYESEVYHLQKWGGPPGEKN
jgi:hypothetical protein